MDIDMKTVGARIKSRRTELGLKQTEIQKEVGISSGNLSEIENGNRTPSMLTLYRLSEILECSIDWIVKGVSSEEKKLTFSVSEDQRELLLNYLTMSKDDQEELLAIAQLKADKQKKIAMARLSHSGNDNSISETA